MTGAADGRTRLAVYDMDLTITAPASWTPWLLHWLGHEAPARAVLLPLMLPALAGFPLGLVDRKRLKEVAQRLVIGASVPEPRLDAAARAFAGRFAARAERPDALASIGSDRAEGFRILLATASSAYYVRHMAARWGVADVVATRNRRDGGSVSNRIDGANCYGPDKLAAIETWCEAQGLERSALFVRAYSDHQADLPLLQWADEPIVISPAPRMAALAAALGWPVRQWR
jgi:HAD superfamily phosphoserine phosphatase-like hydrolase